MCINFVFSKCIYTFVFCSVITKHQGDNDPEENLEEIESEQVSDSQKLVMGIMVAPRTAI
jgi:hypothetical protein